MRIQRPHITPRRADSQPTSGNSSEAEGGKDALDVMLERFGDWDLDGNGQISRTELRRNVADSRIRGEEAAALVTLHSLVSYDEDFRGLEHPSPVTWERLIDLHYEYYGKEDEQQLSDYYLGKYQSLIDSSDKQLFPERQANVRQLKQGGAPSCAFLASVIDQGIKDPAILRNAIKELPMGGYEVRFPGLEKPILIDELSDSEKALFSRTEGNGLWSAVLEKAWGAHQQGAKKNAEVEQSTDPPDAIQAWTQEAGLTTRVPKNPTLEEGELPHYLRTVKRQIDQGKAVITWTRFEDVDTESFVPGHAYTVTDIDEKKGTIALINPWGKHEPMGESGEALDGKDDGVFSYPIADFHRQFGHIARQS